MNSTNEVSIERLDMNSIQKIKKAKLRKNLIVTLGIAVLFVLLVLDFNIHVPIEYRAISSFVFIFLVTLDVSLFIPCVLFNRDIEDVVALFQSVSPNQLFIGKNFVVAEKNNVYMFFKMCTKGILLFHFKEAQKIPGVKMKLPMFILGISRRYKLENISFYYKKTGDFAIPINDEISLRGDCTVYFITDSKIMHQELGRNILMQGISAIIHEH